jgi:hypothetical protein
MQDKNPSIHLSFEKALIRESERRYWTVDRQQRQSMHDEFVKFFEWLPRMECCNAKTIERQGIMASLPKSPLSKV